MNLNSPLLTPAFNGGTTSALSRIPSPFHAFPGGNIGYANRLEGVGNPLTDAVSNVWQSFTGTVGNFAQTYLDTLLGKARQDALKAAGYQFGDPVEVEVGGVRRQGIKARKPSGAWVVVLGDGTEVAWTTDVQSRTVNINPQTGLSSGAAVGIGIGAIALIALLLFKRR